jgi:hypothetical protein
MRGCVGSAPLWMGWKTCCGCRNESSHSHVDKRQVIMSAAIIASPLPPEISWESKGITNLTVHVASSETGSTNPAFASHHVERARWRTPEFIFYGVAFVCVVPFLFICVLDLSSRKCYHNLSSRLGLTHITNVASHRNYALYSHRLSQGWLFGQRVVD